MISRLTSSFRTLAILFGLVGALAGVTPARASESKAAATFFVAPAGSDQGDGSESHPFATLERARDAVHALRGKRSAAQLAGGVEVILLPGTYPRDHAFELTEEDSPGDAVSVTYRGSIGGMARLAGGKQIMPEWFEPVTAGTPEWDRLKDVARGHVVVADLRAHGISQFGELTPRGMHHPGSGAMELFADGQPLPVAQWPQASPDTLQGMGAGFARIEKGSAGTTLVISDPELRRWAKADQIWLHGYWGNLWSDSLVPAAAVDAAGGTVTLAAVPSYAIKPGMPFRVFNLMEEIGAAGQWFLDRKAGKLYLWPTSNWPQVKLSVSTLPGTLIHLKNTHGVLLENLVLDMAWDRLLSIEGGSHNLVRHCALMNAGGDGASISGEANGLLGCVIENTGECGVRLTGGSRAELTPAGNFVQDCDLSHFSRWVWTYTPGVEIQGVGQVVANCRFHDAPHTAILFFGNNHQIESNDIHHVCLFSSDAGAIYAGRHWDYRGTVIRHNFIHELKSPLEAPNIGQNGVYLDDALSGVTIADNLLYEISGDAILCNGGRENIMTGNVIARCGTALEISAFAVKHATDKAGSSWNLVERLGDDGVHYQSGVWAKAYPELAKIPSDWTAIRAPGARWLYPEGSVFEDNLCWKNTHYIRATNVGDRTILDQVFQAKGNGEDVDPGFRNEAAGDLAQTAAVKSDLPGGFPKIDLGAIGPSVESRHFWSQAKSW